MAETLSFREAAYTYRQIAEELKCSVSHAQSMVADAMREITREPSQAVLDLQLSRLHSMLSSVLVDAAGGDHNAIGSALKIMEMINKLSGLDKKEETGGGGQAPSGVHIKMEFVGLEGPQVIDAEYARIEAITGRPPGAGDSDPESIPAVSDEEGEV